MSYEIKGQLKQVFQTQEREVKEKKYYSRDFIIEVFEEVNGQTYSNFPKLTAKGFERCQNLDSMLLGSAVAVSFNVKGFYYTKDGEERNFTSLEAWRIVTEKKADQQQPAQSFNSPETHVAPAAAPEPIDDLPF